ncbi:hypothetical protein Tco_0713391 [Tanacetum coccineum]
MESSSSHSEERELQLMQLEERQLHANCMSRFKELKIHLEFLHNNNSLKMKESEVQAIKEIEKWLKEREIQHQENLSTKGTTLVACLVTEGIAMDDNLIDKESTFDSITSSKQLDECNSLVEQKDTVSSCSDSEEQHMQQLQLQARSQKEMCIKWFRAL